jgi:hypothetical protein
VGSIAGVFVPHYSLCPLSSPHLSILVGNHLYHNPNRKKVIAMNYGKKVSSKGGMSSLEPNKDFAYYIPLVKEVSPANHVQSTYSLTLLKATDLYDSAVENDIDGEEKDLTFTKKLDLELCRGICEDLLANGDLPLEDRILLSYYLCAHREDHIRIFYLKQALATVEVLEAREGNIGRDPMREILETQLKSVEESKLMNAFPIVLHSIFLV